MSIFGDILGAVGGFIGGKKDRESAEFQQAVNIQQQERFAKEGIRWRVEDAKAAGLHPLYAIQGAGASFSPNPIYTNFGETYSRMGQDLGRAATAVVSASEREAMALAKEEVASRIRRNDAEAMFYDSRRARELQDQNQVVVSAADPRGHATLEGIWSVDTPEGSFTQNVTKGGITGYPLPPAAATADFITDQSPKPAWDVYHVGSKLPMLLPSGTNMSEALESISESTLLGAAIISMNLKHYGPGWGKRMAQHFGVSESNIVDQAKGLLPDFQSRIIRR